MNEPGTAAYMGGLRLSQAKDCRTFLDEAMYWKAPTENLICGDVDGTISFQGSALTPNRRGWVGRLPVPAPANTNGTAREGCSRIISPSKGYIATANNNINTSGYWPPVVFKTTTGLPYERITRVETVINSIPPTRKWTIEDTEAPAARSAVAARRLRARAVQRLDRQDADAEKARAIVAAWDGVLNVDSAGAAIHTAWRNAVDQKALDYNRPREEKLPLVEPGLVKAVATLTKEQERTRRAGATGSCTFETSRIRSSSEFDLPTVER